MKFFVKFDLIDCRCGENRVRGQDCECGQRAAAWEVDDAYLRRQGIVRDAKAALSVSVAAPVLDVEELADGGLGEMFGGFVAAVNGLNEGKADSRLVAEARDLAGLRAWAASHVPMRPLLSVGRQVVVAAMAIVDAAQVVLDILAQPTMAAAQRAEKDMNDRLARGGEAISAARQSIEHQREVFGSDDLVSAWAKLTLGSTGPIDFSAIAKAADGIAHHRLGSPCPPGLEASVVIYETMMKAMTEADAFWAAVRGHREAMKGLGSEFVRAVEDPNFARAAAALGHDSWSMARRGAQADPETFREAATVVLNNAHTLIEAGLRPLYAVALAAKRKKPYLSIAAKDAADVIKQAGQQGWFVPEPLANLSVRHAYAHRDYDIEDDLLVLGATRRDRVVLTFDEAVDQMLAVEEGTVAVLLGCELAAADLGATFPDTMHDVPAIRLAAHGLLGIGWNDVDIDTDGDTVVIVAAVDRAVRTSELVMGLEPMPADISKVRFIFRGRAATVIEADMGALRRLQAEQDEHMKTARHIALLAEWTKDGHPLLSPDAVGPGFIVLAMRACTDRSATHLDRHRRVRRLKELLPPSAHKADVELLRRLAGHFNSLALGLPGEPEIVDRVVAAARRENAGLPSDVVFHPAGDR